MFDERRLYEILGDMQEVLDLSYFRLMYLEKRKHLLEDKLSKIPEKKWLVFPNKQWHNVRQQLFRVEQDLCELRRKIPEIEQHVDREGE